jgi:hypothetical protein
MGFNLASMHACSQAYFPLLDFLSQVRHFWMSTCAPFIYTQVNP